eukprot:5485490-Pyramimonas_sp.AAC.1
MCRGTRANLAMETFRGGPDGTANGVRCAPGRWRRWRRGKGGRANLATIRACGQPLYGATNRVRGCA